MSPCRISVKGGKSSGSKTDIESGSAPLMNLEGLPSVIECEGWMPDSQNKSRYAFENVLIEVWIARISRDDPENGNEPPKHIRVPFAQSLFCRDDHPCDT